MNDRSLATHNGITIDQESCKPQLHAGRARFLSTLFGYLDHYEMRYCVLHSWDELPENLTSDLDIAVHPTDYRVLPRLFQSLHQEGYTAIQALNYSVNGHYFVFVWSDGVVICSAALDVIVEHRRGGLVVSSGESLVSGRLRQKNFWIPSPESEFTYLLAKKTCKGAAAPQQTARLKALVEQLGQPRAENLAGTLFLGNLKTLVVRACGQDRVATLLPRLRKKTWVTSFWRNPWKLGAYLLGDGARRVRRWLKPTGFFIVVMGPDGAGKSTLIRQVMQTIGPAFRQQRSFHWRPNFLWRREGVSDTSQPHQRAQHGSFCSVITLIAYLTDYWCGYWLSIRPLVARSSLVMFDRYFDDLLVDPRRYRYGGSLRLVRIFRSLIPRPDLVLILDAPVNVILSRKQEVLPEEVERQRALYRKSYNGSSTFRVIDATASPAEVTFQATRVILHCLAERFEQRHTEWLIQGRAALTPSDGLKIQVKGPDAQ